MSPKQASPVAAKHGSLPYFPIDERDLIKAFILGDQLSSEMFRNHIIDCLATKLSQISYLPTHDTIRRTYDQTPANSPLKRLLVDVMIHEGADDYLKDISTLPTDFVTQVTQKLLAARGTVIRGKDGPYYNNLCTNYHEHADGTTCPRQAPYVNYETSSHKVNATD